MYSSVNSSVGKANTVPLCRFGFATAAMGYSSWQAWGFGAREGKPLGVFKHLNHPSKLLISS